MLWRISRKFDINGNNDNEDLVSDAWTKDVSGDIKLTCIGFRSDVHNYMTDRNNYVLPTAKFG